MMISQILILIKTFRFCNFQDMITLLLHTSAFIKRQQQKWW